MQSKLHSAEIQWPPIKQRGESGWFALRGEGGLGFYGIRHYSKHPPQPHNGARLGPHTSKRNLMLAIDAYRETRIKDLRNELAAMSGDPERERGRLKQCQDYSAKQSRIKHALHRLADDLRHTLAGEGWLARWLRNPRVDAAAVKLMQFDESKVQ